jgi:hypothetical protein
MTTLLHYLRCARALALLSATTLTASCAAAKPADASADTNASAMDALSDVARTDGDASSDALEPRDGSALSDDAASAMDSGALDAFAQRDVVDDGAFASDVAAGSCADDAGPVVFAPFGDADVSDAASPCLLLSGATCATPGALACGGPGGATRYGCLCSVVNCSNEGGTRLAWICGGGGALPPPELDA